MARFARMMICVAVLAGPEGHRLLPACGQDLDAQFGYQGGWLPLARPLAQRAARLAEAVIASLPRGSGYLGIDLVLGDDPGGADDVVIEVNPRLTTSYVGLRAATSDNLSAAMLELAEGRSACLSFDADEVHFRADGKIEPRRPAATSDENYGLAGH